LTIGIGLGHARTDVGHVLERAAVDDRADGGKPHRSADISEEVHDAGRVLDVLRLKRRHRQLLTGDHCGHETERAHDLQDGEFREAPFRRQRVRGP
jgi:hypothetical protein